MTDNARVQAMVDKFEIIENSINTLHCRDSADWNGLAQCFHDDAQLTTSWFKGTAKEFAEQSRRMMDGHHPTDTQRHRMGNPRVKINGNRAVCEFYVILYQGRTLDGYEFDFQTWSVSLDFYEKRDGAWRVCRRANIYEKDRMDPHVPGSVPQSYWDGLDLSKYPAAVRYHCYRNERSSGHAPKNMILKGSPGETAARADAAAWLAAGA
jgi:hypothetical protein